MRAAAVFLAALVLITAVAFVAQRSTYHRGPLLDAATTAPVAPPPVAVAPATRPAASGGTTATATGVPTIATSWLERTARQSGVPEVALQAYARASLEAPSSCGLGWTTLAGIGWIESQHGTLGDRQLLADGHSSTPILGPALDGTNHTKAIPATPETSLLHGDPRWDHAVGPMQFIPSTWQTWAADGDGDGVADPNDIDDAALAAADYLCADGHDLTTPEGWTAAILSYNVSAQYLDDVHGAAVTYAERTAG